MKRILALLAVALHLGAPLAGRAGDPVFLFADEQNRRIARCDADGRETVLASVEMARDAWMLPNSNLLFCFNQEYRSDRHDKLSGVVELTPDGREQFRFATTGQVFSCQRLPNGHTLIGAASQGRLIEVDAATNIVRTITVKNTPGHSCMRYARGLPDGGCIVAEESAHAVRDYAPDGSLRGEIKLDFPPFAVVRLPDGHTLVSGRNAIVEFDAATNSVWRLEAGDLPALGIRWFAGFQVLPNGHLFVCNAGGKVGFFEVVRDQTKAIVWQSTGNPALGHAVQRLDVPLENALR